MTTDNPPHLRTSRLDLSPFCRADLPALLRLFHNPDVRRYLWDDELVTAEVVEGVIQASERDFSEQRCGFFGLRLQAESALAGFCGMRQAEDSIRHMGSAELLYGLLPDYWGQGLATESARCVLRYAAEHCNTLQVLAATDVPNKASVEVMQRLGMLFAGEHKFHDLDTLFYTIDTRTLGADVHRPAEQD